MQHWNKCYVNISLYVLYYVCSFFTKYIYICTSEWSMAIKLWKTIVSRIVSEAYQIIKHVDKQSHNGQWLTMAVEMQIYKTDINKYSTVH